MTRLDSDKTYGMQRLLRTADWEVKGLRGYVLDGLIGTGAGGSTAGVFIAVVDHAPGPRLAVSTEGTRSYGVGLTRAAAAAGLVVHECEEPNRKARRGRGKSTRSTPAWPC